MENSRVNVNVNVNVNVFNYLQSSSRESDLGVAFRLSSHYEYNTCCPVPSSPSSNPVSRLTNTPARDSMALPPALISLNYLCHVMHTELSSLSLSLSSGWPIALTRRLIFLKVHDVFSVPCFLSSPNAVAGYKLHSYLSQIYAGEAFIPCPP
jgi:hypothetical protein